MRQQDKILGSFFIINYAGAVMKIAKMPLFCGQDPCNILITLILYFSFQSLAFLKCNIHSDVGQGSCFKKYNNSQTPRIRLKIWKR